MPFRIVFQQHISIRFSSFVQNGTVRLTCGLLFVFSQIGNLSFRLRRLSDRNFDTVSAILDRLFYAWWTMASPVRIVPTNNISKLERIRSREESAMNLHVIDFFPLTWLLMFRATFPVRDELLESMQRRKPTGNWTWNVQTEASLCPLAHLSGG